VDHFTELKNQLCFSTCTRKIVSDYPRAKRGTYDGNGTKIEKTKEEKAKIEQ